MTTTRSFFGVPRTTAQKWTEVARRVADGSAFSTAVWSVFDQSPSEVAGTEWNLYAGDFGGNDHEYILAYSMLSDFLAYEAEDEENERLLIQHLIDANPEPVTMVAAEEPVSGFWEDAPEERRSSWNAKLADGMRKWADWVEARF